jgi:DNA helicase HerA-like ATPase
MENFDSLRDLSIGTVEYVSPSEIKVLLDIDAPQNTAINTGTPTAFPRINGYVIIPNEIGGIVGIINWMSVEHSNFPRRKGFKDFDLIDLPFPLRKMSVNPIGTLKTKGDLKNQKFELERGVYSFPSIGDYVAIPSQEQLKAIVENKDENAKISIGKATLAGNADVYVDPDKLFGRHLAVLGNTGSGKSCSVAGLIRWSLEAAKAEIANHNSANGSTTPRRLNSRFIILDPNGEYTDTFNDLGSTVRRFKISLTPEVESGFKELQVPAWMWNSTEWINFSQAAPGTQRPILLQGLVGLKRGNPIANQIETRLVRGFTGYKAAFENWMNSQLVNMSYPEKLNCGGAFKGLKEELNFFSEHFTDEPLSTLISEAITECERVIEAREYQYNGRTGFNTFNQTDFNEIVRVISDIISEFPESDLADSPITADMPTPFDILTLPDFLGQIALNEQGRDLSQFISMLSLRLRQIFSDVRLKNVVNPESSVTLEEWLKEYIGSEEDSQICIIDLSLIPSDVTHIIVAVLGRLIFEALQRYRRKQKEELPTVLVLEEAHTFIHESNFDTNYGQICLRTFERIAREGRKFGLSLVLSSQRPSELSPTVLSQCNTFLLHRLVNDLDQQLVRKLVPDNVGGLLKELPILPTRKAILLGWATPIPMLIEINELKKEHTPQSKDPDFWKVWTGENARPIDWTPIANEWQGRSTSGAADPPDTVESSPDPEPTPPEDEPTSPVSLPDEF